MTNIINRIRQPIDRALDRVVDWIVGLARRVVGGARAVAGQVAGQVAGWWRQRKPFTTAGGAGHEIYFAGDERNPQPMVASGTPTPLTRKLDQYAVLARAADAAPPRRAALDTVNRLRNTATTTPDSPSLVTGMKSLFEIFEEQAAVVKQTQLLRQSQTSIGGSQVAVHMVVDWLDAAYGASHGSPPAGGAISTVMDRPGHRPRREQRQQVHQGPSAQPAAGR